MVALLALSVSVDWSDAVKLASLLGVCATFIAVFKGGKKVTTTLTAILDSVDALGEVQNKVDAIETEVHSLRTETDTKHRANTVRLDAISAQMAGQKSTGEFIAEVLGKPVQEIANALRLRREDGPTA